MALQAVAFVEKKAHEMGVNAIHLEVDRGTIPHVNSTGERDIRIMIVS